MIYDITKKTAPTMPRLGKGTECIKILLSQASKFMYEPLIPVLFPLLGAKICDVKFQYPDLIWKELCGQMVNIVAENGGNKDQLSYQMESICRDFHQNDEAEEARGVAEDGQDEGMCGVLFDRLHVKHDVRAGSEALFQTALDGGGTLVDDAQG